MALFQQNILKSYTALHDDEISAAYGEFTDQIAITDHAIDRLVYALYGLTEEEYR